LKRIRLCFEWSEESSGIDAGRRILCNQIITERIVCEINAYLIEENDEQLIMESVERVEPDGQRYRLSSIFGEEKTLDARFYAYSANRIVFKANPD